MKQQSFGGFSVDVFFDSDAEWVAHFIEMPFVLALASTPNKAVEELVVVWEGIKESYHENGREFPFSPFGN